MNRMPPRRPRLADLAIAATFTCCAALAPGALPDDGEEALPALLRTITAFQHEHGRAMTRAELEAATARFPALAQGAPEVLRDRQAAIVTAWEATRPAPAIASADLGAVLAFKRDALSAFDATVLVRVTIDADRAPDGFAPSASGRSSRAYLVRSAFSADRRYLEVAPVVADPRPVLERATRIGSAQRAGPESNALVSPAPRMLPGIVRVFDGATEAVADHASGIGWIGVPDSLEPYTDRFEPWPAVAGLIGDRRRGTARARESDLGALLADADPGLAVVEPELEAIDGHACVVLRYGWRDPLTIWLDPALGFAPRRMEERLALEDGAIRAVVRFGAHAEAGNGLWLPRRVVRTQTLVGDGRGGDDGHADPVQPRPAAPYLRVEMLLRSLAADAEVAETLFEVRRAFPPGMQVIERSSGAVCTAPLPEVDSR